MVNNTSVLIKYSNKNRYKFQQYAEFLRFIGYFVCEYLKEDDDSEKLDKYIFNFELDLDFDDDTEINNNINTWFDGSETELRELKDVFSKWNLFQASVTLQYFSTNASLATTAGNLFKSAADELDSFYCNNKSRINFEFEYYYAQLYCKQKTNSACFLSKKVLYYPIDELIEQCNNLHRLYPENENIYVLEGLIYENTTSNRINTVQAYIAAKENIGEEPYVSSVLYRMAKACEGEEGLRWLMNEAYENAYNIIPKYRNIYKVAWQYLEMEANCDAIEYFQECISKIENRQEYMTPLEQKYLFMTNSHLAYLSISNNQFFEATKYAHDALNLKKRIIQEKTNPDGFNKFCYEIYQNNEVWNVINIINAELDIMAEDNINRYLALAYRRVGLYDMAEEYSDKLKH